MDTNLSSASLNQNAISYRYISRPENTAAPLFTEIYDVYKSGFPHGARKPEFFERMFALNVNDSVQKRWGIAHYEIAYASRQGKVIATAMYMAIFAPPAGWPDSHYHAAVAIDYRSVLPEARGCGLAGELEKRAVGRTVARLKKIGRIRRKDDAFTLPVNERARSLAMPLGAFAEDVRLVGINPFDREKTWDKAGLHRVLPCEDVPLYFEPPSKDGDPICDYYSFNVKTGGVPIGARTIEDIIMRYAALRRMDGEDPCQNAEFAKMMAQIREKVSFTPVADTPYLSQFRQAADDLLAKHPAIPQNLANRSMESLILRNGLE